MPIGTPTSQTLRTKRYEKNVGIIAKTYKLKRSDTDRFAEACKVAGSSQSAEITRMIREYSDKVLGK